MGIRLVGSVRGLSLLAAASLLWAAGCHETEFVVGPQPDSSWQSVVVIGNGIVVEETRAIGGCSGVDLQGVGGLYIRQGPREQLTVRAEENLLPYLKTEVHAGTLLIWKDPATLRNTHPIEYHLTLVDVDRVVLSGAGQIRGEDLRTGPLQVSLLGAGNVEIVGLDATGLDVGVSGAGNATLSGSVEEQAITLSSAGAYDGRDLDSARADVLIRSIGSATVRVRDRLDATIDGSGSVYYVGDPVVHSLIRGSGDVVQIAG